jgi:ATP-dependent Clp protease adaptor protein ClpS
MSSKEKTSVTPELSENLDSVRKLILFNDDYNSFDFIINSLIDVCKHDSRQAENCAIIAHYNGKCHIKNGDMAELRPIYVEMINRKITVEIA